MTRSTTEPNLLTIAELARNLELPESTTRYYCNRFAAHLPSVGEGRRRRYKPEALETLKTIAQTMRRDKNAFAVDLALRNGQNGACIPAVAQPLGQEQAHIVEQLMAMMETQTRALQDIAAAVTVFPERFSLPVPAPAGDDTPAPAASAPVEGEDSLRQEIAALKEQIRASESVHQNDLEQLRKWLTRLGEAVAGK